MRFKKYYKSLSAEDKKDLADRMNTSLAYLSQLANGHRKAGAKILLQIESSTGGLVSAVEMRDEASG